MFLDCLIIVCVVEICMGVGKGVLDYWVCIVKLGKIFYEFVGVLEIIVCLLMCIVVYKMLVKIKFFICDGYVIE